jgi:hypothetical protein
MSEYVSFIIQSWQRGGDDTMRWKVYLVRGEEEISFPDASFLVRVWIDDGDQIVRGLIRHVQSGREMQFQSSDRAVEFIRAWMDGDSGVLENSHLVPAPEGGEEKGQPDGQPL